MQGFNEDQIDCEQFLNLRYDGTDVAMMTKQSSEHETYEQVSCLSDLVSLAVQLPEKYPCFVQGIPFSVLMMTSLCCIWNFKRLSMITVKHVRKRDFHMYGHKDKTKRALQRMVCSFSSIPRLVK